MSQLLGVVQISMIVKAALNVRWLIVQIYSHSTAYMQEQENIIILKECFHLCKGKLAHITGIKGIW